MKKILVIGNLGYVGSVLSDYLRKYPEFEVIGYDNCYFNSFLTIEKQDVKNNFIHHQIFGDIRNIQEELFTGIYGVILLAAVSNDPIGNKFSAATKEINEAGSKHIITLAKRAGVKKFVFASSCSVYGSSNDTLCTEETPTRPLTPYAKSKVAIEEHLSKISSTNFKATSLRFATACGVSNRMRLDLVLNDFVANAIFNNEILLKSKGTQFRPLIDVKDMARLLKWGLNREDGQNHMILNAGSKAMNFSILDLAEKTAEYSEIAKVRTADDVHNDPRSYMVDFSLLEQCAPDCLPRVDLYQSISELFEFLKNIPGLNNTFREGNLIRLNTLERLVQSNLMDRGLNWKI